MKAVIRHISLRGYRRIVAISDIHGQLDYLQGLLQKVRFSAEDALVLVGDLTEKGPDSLGVVRYVMQLARGGNVFAVEGNCDDCRLQDLLAEGELSAMCSYMDFRLAHWQGHSILWEMCREAQLTDLYYSAPAQCQRLLRQRYQAEWAFLQSLPVVLVSEDCFFVHAALPRLSLDTLTVEECIRAKAFHTQAGPRFPKTCIVGHWPVVLYNSERLCDNPLYSAQRNLFSIDGSCVLKEDGQLNALIRNNADGCWSFAAYDRFPLVRATDTQPAGGDTACYQWGDTQVELLEEQGEFVRCRHLSTGRELLIPADWLYRDADGQLCCSDHTAYRLPVLPGDILSLVRQTSRGCYVKKNGVCGWYDGGWQPLAPSAAH